MDRMSQATVIAACALFLFAGSTQAAINLPFPPGTVVESFDSLDNTPAGGGSGTGTTFPTSWEAGIMPAVGMPTPLTQYTTSDGSPPISADVFSWGSAESNENSFGFKGSQNATGDQRAIGVEFANAFSNTTFIQINISARGEQWHQGVSDQPTTLRFEYSIDATNVIDNTATWIANTDLDIVLPKVSGAGPNGNALNGNSFTNQVFIGDTFDARIEPGETLFIRWLHEEDGSDHGGGIDFFRLTTVATEVPEPHTAGLAMLGIGALLARRRNRHQA